jgi:hypothetical protein
MRLRGLAVALLLALPQVALAQVPAAAPGQAGWAPAGNDCFVWNRAPQIGEVATWSGPCKNKRADGRGTLVWRTGEDSQRYQGDMRDGHLNGQGVYEFSLTARYDGTFKDDDFDGKGTMIEPGVRYEGQWRAGKRNGRGVLTTVNGDRYEGEFKDDGMTGRGTLVLSDGRKYEGLLVDGKPNGQGTLTERSGTYTGAWKNGCFNDGQRRAAFGTKLDTCS